MDDYRAVFVKRFEGLDDMWWTDAPEILYRKGSKFRRDWGCDGTGDRYATERPADDEDLCKWWSERTKFFVYHPVSVVAIRRPSTPSGRRPLIPMAPSIRTSFQFRRGHPATRPVRFIPSGQCGQSLPADLLWASAARTSNRSLTCTPPKGLPDASASVSAIRRGSELAEQVGTPDVIRYWLDPQRDFIVVRWDWVMHDKRGKENITEIDSIEETARSPQGVWYATRVRRHFPVPAGEPAKYDQVYHIYIDFKADLPDSLFEPPRSGRIH